MRLGRVRNLINAGLVGLLLSCGGESPTAPNPPPSTKPPTQQQNRSPIDNSSPVTTCDENSLYTSEIHASDPDGDPLSYSLIQKPGDWMAISGNLISGTCPEVFRDSIFTVEYGISDGKAPVVSRKYSLTDRNKFNVYLLSGSQSKAPGMNAADTAFTFTVNSDTSISFPYEVGIVTPDRVASGITPQTPQGLLREVTSVSPDKKRIYTKQAILEETVKKASIPFTKQLLLSEMQSPSGMPGVYLSPNAPAGFNFSLKLEGVIYDRDGRTSTTNDQITIDGDINFNLGLNLNLDIDWFKLKNFVFKQTLTDSANIRISSNFYGLASSPEIKLYEMPFNPITIGTLPTVPPIPVIITPKIEIIAGIDPTSANPVSLGMRQNAELSTTITYDETNKWNSSFTISNNFEPLSNSIGTGDWILKAYTGPRLKIPFYGIIGPEGGINAYLKLQSQNFNWKFSAGIEAMAEINARFPILGKGAVTIASLKTTLEEKILAQKDTIVQPPADTASILFYSRRDGNGEIYITNADGSKQTNLTSNSDSWDKDPTWSPDRRKIAFISDRNENRQIYIMNLDDSYIKKVTANIYADNPNWSPDGNQIAFTRRTDSGSGTDIYILDLNTGNLKPLTNDTHSFYPYWSPDGSRIAFTGSDGGGHEIFTINKDGSDRKKLTNNSYYQQDRWPSWSPDGTKIVFSSNRDGHEEIYIMNSDGSGQINLTKNSDIDDVYPSWSPDGKKIVYASSSITDPYYDIWIMSADGSGKIKLTNTPTLEDNNPRWSR